MSNGDPVHRCRMLIAIISRFNGNRYFPSPSTPAPFPEGPFHKWKEDFGLVIFSSSTCCIISLGCRSFRGDALFLLPEESG
ncbi:hypothetical protein CEXT_730021 [Caerostris extrusa]|uniref:Uncharacterized protein n=1 Tax=Caerostris extrusa TaxID=172846 RepID=A0AAV4PF28_CAEEX|nr:hypothetical protein CEXT_730021 [Caerostris extrusa]